MITNLLSLLPPRALRFIGRLQFTSPLLRPLIQAAARRFAAADRVIKHGIGAGLKFNATGSAAGYLLGTSEIEEQELLAKVLNPGDTFYDVGANVGFYSTIAARLVGPQGIVYAFEPFGPSAEMAKHNARLNGFTNVTVIQTAVAAEDGVAWLDSGSSHLSTHYRLTKEASRGRVEVPVTTVDNFVARHNLPGPSVIMIDVEGGEIEVLRGMLKTVRTYRPTIMCEVHWTGDAFGAFLDHNLLELDYQAAMYDGRPLPKVPCRYHAFIQPRHRA